MLCRFAEHVFDCYRIIMGECGNYWWDFCFVDCEGRIRRHQISGICWLTVCFVCVAICFGHVMLMLYYIVIKQQVLIFLQRRKGRNWECEWCGLFVEIYFVCVEFCTNDMVLLMFGFFRRSGHPIEISRWVSYAWTNVWHFFWIC